MEDVGEVVEEGVDRGEVVEDVGEAVEEVVHRGEVVEEVMDRGRWWKRLWTGERLWWWSNDN